MRQKDWIIYNNRSGNLWCLAIEQQADENWYLIEWVNFQGLSQTMLRKMVDMGYKTMLDAAIKQHDYDYIIGHYSFKPGLIAKSEYFNGLLPSGLKGKKSTKIEVNKFEFEKQVDNIFKKWGIDFEG